MNEKKTAVVYIYIYIILNPIIASKKKYIKVKSTKTETSILGGIARIYAISSLPFSILFQFVNNNC